VTAALTAWGGGSTLLLMKPRMGSPEERGC